MAFRLCCFLFFVFLFLFEREEEDSKESISLVSCSIWIGVCIGPTKISGFGKEVIIHCCTICLGALFLRGHILPAIVLYQLILILVYEIVTALLTIISLSYQNAL